MSKVRDVYPAGISLADGTVEEMCGTLNEIYNRFDETGRHGLWIHFSEGVREEVEDGAGAECGSYKETAR